MSLLTVERSLSFEGILDSSGESPSESEGLSVNDEDEKESDDQVTDLDLDFENYGSKHPKLGRLRSPSFAGYFASRSGAVSLPDGNKARTASPLHSRSCDELQRHLQTMVTLLRENDVMKMAVRIESVLPDKKRYLMLVTSPTEESLLIGIDWGSGPTLGLVMELESSTVAKLDGDGGFHVASSSQLTHCFKPVSVQTLWSAMHVIQHGINNASRHDLEKEGYRDFVHFYRNKITSDPASISEWNMMDNLMSTRQFDLVLSETEESEQAAVKKLLRPKLKEVMIRVDLDMATSRQIRNLCEEELGMDLSEFKSYLDNEMFMILGQMDSASKIFDYLYLGSEWNASDLVELKNLGIGYILNLTKEIDNFFPDTFSYLNIRVYDEEDTELLPYWDHTYKFINKAKLAGSKVLVHCRRGISRSASSVIAYIMKSRNWSLPESMEYVKKCRSIVEPNAGFQKQLIIYEGILNSSRNRYNALFRQRSKSERQLPSSARDKRQSFTSTRSKEISDDTPDKTIAETQGHEADDLVKPKRPKSWAPESTTVHEIMKSVELPPLAEQTDKEPPSTENASGNTEEGLKEQENKDSEDGGHKQERKKRQKRRSLSRAKTLPCQSPRHWEMSGEEEKSSEESAAEERRDEKEEVIIEQAMAASQMKRNLLRSLVQLKEQRETKTLPDSQFFIESIIRPSSLRKVSKSGFPLERRNSFSEDTALVNNHKLRQRAMTIGPSRLSVGHTDVSDSNGITKEDLIAENARRLLTKQSLKVSEEEDANLAMNDIAGNENSGMINRNNGENSEVFRNADGTEISKQETGDAGNELQNLDQMFESTSVEPSSTMNTSRDISIDKKSETFVVKTSQFKTVKDSAKKIEAWQKARRGRFSRKPRRHTVGGPEILKELEREMYLSAQTRSKSSDGRSQKRDSSSSPINRVSKNTDSDDSTSGSSQSYTIESLSISQSKSEIENQEIDRKKPVFDVEDKITDGELDKADVEYSKEEENGVLCNLNADDLSVRDLVEKHKQLIHRISSSNPDDASTNIASSSPVATSPLLTDMSPHDVATSPAHFSTSTAGGIPEYSSKPDGDMPADQNDDSEHKTSGDGPIIASGSQDQGSKIDIDVVKPGIVKRQSLLFTKAFNLELPSNEPVHEPETGLIPDSETAEVMENSVSKRGRKRSSVKERLQQLEGFQKKSLDIATKRPVSLHGCDDEVANIMEPSENKNSLLTVSTGNTPKSKSAPCSPRLSKHTWEIPEKEHHSSLSDLTSVDSKLAAQDGEEVFIDASQTETPSEIVRSLVDRFEEC